MSDFQRFEKALQAAEQAGDVEGAKTLAVEMRRMMLQNNPSLADPVDTKREAAKMAAKGTGIPDALAIGAGRTTDKFLAGLEQVAHLARTTPAPMSAVQTPPELAQESLQRLPQLAEEQKDKDIAYSGLQKERPIASSVGEVAPYAGLPMSSGLLSSAAMVGGLDASKYGSVSERAARGLLGAGGQLGAGMVGKGLGKIIAPVDEGAVSGAQRAALDSMDRMGVQPRMSQVTGSPFMARVEDWAARTPGGAGVMRKFGDANTAAINQHAASGIGTSASELTPAVFAETSQRLGKVFEEIKGLPGRPIQIGQKVNAAADEILRQQGKMLPTQQDANLMALANQAKALAANKGRIDGEAYQLMRSGLSEASFDATGSNRVLYGKLLEALDDSADTSLRAIGNGSLADALKTVRPQYANLKTLEKGSVSEGGNVSPARLASAMRTNNPAAFREGRMAGNPLYDIAQYGEAFKPLQAGSPTYERTLMSNPLSTTLGAMTSYPAAKLATSPLATAYPRMALGSGLPGLLAAPAEQSVRVGGMGLLNQLYAAGLLPVVTE